MLPAAETHRELLGSKKPRIAPPLPARHDLPKLKAEAEKAGLTLLPWQEVAAKYLTAKGPNGLAYREVCILVARQNGKTTLMKPLILSALREGKRVMHIAQSRELPRQMFGLIADALSDEPELFPKRRGKIIWPRYGAGQEEILLTNGGSYRIAAAKTGGARGFSNDLVIIDELREMTNFDIIAAAEPTLTMSDDPQIVYLSNAGDDDAVVLRSVQARSGKDESLAYLEWSAAPERLPIDRAGWAESNPALGHKPSVERTLEAAYTKHSLAGTMAIFETEHLCRYVPTLRERLVTEAEWMACVADDLPLPKTSHLGVSMDPSGKRAAAAIAWQRPDGTIGVRQAAEFTGDPIEPMLFGRKIMEIAAKYGVLLMGYDRLTDNELAKYLPKKQLKPVIGGDFANASARFVSSVESGQLRWTDAPGITNDLVWTAKKRGERGAFEAVRSSDDRPIPAALAAIRAVWLASGPPPAPARIF